MAGMLTISIELELGWGVHDLNERSHLSENGVEERKFLQKLLQKTDEHDIPISFDIIGHLLLSGCDGMHNGPYPTGWFDSDPGSDVFDAPLFYAPDIAEDILSSDTEHELCTHTFSHLLCSEASDELLDLELQRVQELHTNLDKKVSSFVPPRHQRPKNEILRKNGIRVARYAKAKRSPSKLHRFKELTIGPHIERNPEIHNGVLETYCTTYPSLTARSLPSGQRTTGPIFRRFPLHVRKRIHRYYLSTATQRSIKSETPLHLWCHLYDLSNRHQWEVLDGYLDFLSEIPDRELQVKTMEGLGDEFHE